MLQSGENKQRAAIYINGSVEEIGAPRLVQLICHRWGEENTIKELLHKHRINHTPGYLSYEQQTQPLVDNPKEWWHLVPDQTVFGSGGQTDG